MALTPKHKRQLQAQAHSLNPVVTIGNQGLTDAVLAEVGQALNHHELIKVRLPSEDKLTRNQLAREIAIVHEAELVQTIGRIAVLFKKKRKDPKSS